MLAVQLAMVKAQVLEIDRRIMPDARRTELGRRLMAIPGVGPLLASAFVATVADPGIILSGRDLAAWIGLVPRQNSSGGKERLGTICKAARRNLALSGMPRPALSRDMSGLIVHGMLSGSA
jgi:transposase